MATFFAFLLPFLLAIYSAASRDHDLSSSGRTSIVFATLGSRSRNAFDIFTLSTAHGHPPDSSNEIQITDGQSLNFNGFFPSLSSCSALLSLLPDEPLIQSSALQNSTCIGLVYVTERGGSTNIYFDLVDYGTPGSTRSRSTLETAPRVQVPLLDGNNIGVSFKDKPSVSGDYLIYVSTHEDPGVPRASWAAVYSTQLKTGFTRRLTPYGIADFSPAVSPSGVYTAVASYGERGWTGEVEELSTDIYIFLTSDGTHRVKIVEHGGWPSWVDDLTLYFHRKGEDGWVSVYKATLPSNVPVSSESVIIERVTPPGLHAFTPATSPGNSKFIAVATRRPNSGYRHIELFDLVKKEFIELTRFISPRTHHFNPFISSDSDRVGYHRCRGASNDEKVITQFMLENLKSPVSDISLFRIDGSFPSWSPDGSRIAFVGFPGVYVVNRDGSNRRQVYPGDAFGTIWDPVRPSVVYSSAGPDFASESIEVDIISIDVDDQTGSFRKLTTNGKNNAFPAISPDGKWIVFRSGRSGYKNLYIMDAVEGERGGLRRLTEGPWSDTMCSWSSNGDWIAFASDREAPGSGSFELFLIHPNGTGLKKLIENGSGGRTNHPYFSPDGNSIVFTTDHAGISAEPISNPHQFQPYGEIYIVKLDGSDLRRLTSNSFEDGTPAWGPTYIKPVDLEWPKHGPYCSFEDCRWLAEMPNNTAVFKQLSPSQPKCCRG